MVDGFTVDEHDSIVDIIIVIYLERVVVVNWLEVHLISILLVDIVANRLLVVDFILDYPVLHLIPV